jgi:hypothetical protein
MPFKKFELDQTISAEDINNNFYELYRGTILPRSGLELLPTSLYCDIGSIDNNFNVLYVADIVSSFTSNLYRLLSSYSGIDNNITFSELNGDKQKEYLIYFSSEAIGESTTISIILNNDTSTNYGYQKTSQFNSSSYSNTSGSNFIIYKQVNYAIGVNIKGLAKINILNSKIGKERIISIQESGLYQTGTTIKGIWNNSTDTLTSISINGTGTAKKYIYLYARDK